MNKFVQNILLESGYNKYVDSSTQEMIDILLDRNEEYDPEHGYPKDYLSVHATQVSGDDESKQALIDELKKLAASVDDSVKVKIDKKKFIALQEAVKCPVIRNQFVEVDLCYAKVKVTTECLYKAIRNQVLQRALFPNQVGDGLFVRVNKQLLLDNNLFYQSMADSE